jgi:hypothetical protein
MMWLIARGIDAQYLCDEYDVDLGLGKIDSSSITKKCSKFIAPNAASKVRTQPNLLALLPLLKKPPKLL